MTDRIAMRLVMPRDLNPANRLFGGKMMAWIDEAAAIYAIGRLKTNRIVTKKISEVNFESPALQGDMLEFFASTAHIGRTSLTVRVDVQAKRFTGDAELDVKVSSCDVVFVAVDENGKSTPHNAYEVH
jgi:acyl-CoA hydrolase